MTRRTKQVADSIQRVLSETIQFELKDPRVQFATIVGVDVSADLQYARVYVSVMGDEEQRSETMRGLISARGFLRRRMAEELRHLRTVPELRLELDTSLDYSMHIDDLLRQIADERDERTDAEPHDDAQDGKHRERGTNDEP